LPLAVGFAFSASWEEAGEIMSTVTLLILAVLVTLYLAVYLIILVKRTREKRLARSAENQTRSAENQNSSPLGIRTLDFSKEGGDTLPL
jgi:sorbitol-specific phosphotransferase system component IIC